MTNEEALNWFRDDLKNGKCSDECPQCNAMEKAIEALEKQIPKKPNLWCGKIITCPNCLRAISQTEALDVHCKYCGQFIDWSDTNV